MSASKQQIYVAPVAGQTIEATILGSSISTNETASFSHGFFCKKAGQYKLFIDKKINGRKYEGEILAKNVSSIMTAFYQFCNAVCNFELSQTAETSAELRKFKTAII